MKVGLAQINTTVGDVAGNEAAIRRAYQKGVAAGVDLVMAPELALVGYPPRDLLLKPALIQANLAALDPPLHLVIRFEANLLANRFRKSHPTFLIKDGRVHRGIIPPKSCDFKLRFSPPSFA